MRGNYEATERKRNLQTKDCDKKGPNKISENLDSVNATQCTATRFQSRLQCAVEIVSCAQGNWAPLDDGRRAVGGSRSGSLFGGKMARGGCGCLTLSKVSFILASCFICLCSNANCLLKTPELLNFGKWVLFAEHHHLLHV